MKNSKNSYKQAGFTLIELLVSLTIFVTLSALGWQVFDQLQKTRSHVSVQAEKLSELQYAYMQLNRDVNQYVNRVGYSVAFNKVNNHASDGNFSVGLDILDNQISFTRKANFDPRFIGVAQSSFERVTYKLEDNKIIRYSTKDIDNTNVKPLPTVLLEGVTSFSVIALDPGRQLSWPPDTDDNNMVAMEEPTDEEMQKDSLQLPLGIDMRFEYMDTPITWRFALVKTLPQVKPPKNEKDKKPENEKDKNPENETAKKPK